MRRCGAVCCRWHVAVFAVLFSCSLMSLFCLDPKLVSTCVILAPSTVDSFMWAPRYSSAMLLFFLRLSFFDSCACVSVDCPGACGPLDRQCACVPVCPCARVPVDSSCVRVPMCPCARVPVDSSCARVPVDSSCARVPVCPAGREETYLKMQTRIESSDQTAHFTCLPTRGQKILPAQLLGQPL